MYVSCAISVCNILTVVVHRSSTPSVSGPGSATVGHVIFSTVIPIPSFSTKDSCRYWQNLTLGHFVDITIKQLVDGSI